MALVDLWEKSKEQIEEKRLRQIIAIAGSGQLKDDGDASIEFRAFLSQIPSEMLARYADECLTDKSDDPGLALQDIVNEIGSRLGYHVSPGRYRGSSGKSGHDGLWSSQEHTLLVEVKTTDAYRISLDVIAKYRVGLIQSSKLEARNSSILLVVGRQDTGDLEAQIRGSKHAWDIRVISVSALLRLMRVKESVEDPRILGRISGILVPQEFTRVDGIVDLVFQAAEEVLQEADTVKSADAIEGVSGKKEPKFVPVDYREACIERIRKFLKQPLVRQSRATFSNPDGSLIVACWISREHGNEGSEHYWYALYDHQRATLAKAPSGYFAFGCGSETRLLLIPFKEFDPWIDGMNSTKDNDRMYWHVFIHREGNRLVLRRKKGQAKVDLDKYKV